MRTDPFNQLIQRLEVAIAKRSRLVIERLQPGLPESRIEATLIRSKIEGNIKPIVDLYSWKNGTVLDPELVLSRTGFFPGLTYQFVDLKFAIAHMRSFSEVAEYQPQLTKIVDNYFPSFWDGATGWLAVDLKESNNSRVMRIEFEADDPLLKAYSSFEEFLEDATRANEEDNTLKWTLP